MKINPLVIVREEPDGGALLFNPENGETHGLNPTALLIWKQLARNAERPAILRALAEACGPLPDCATADLDEFIATLTDQGYLSC